MRTLFVTTADLWPPTNGTSIRSAMTLRGLARNGSVDVVAVSRDGAPKQRGPLPISQLATVTKPASSAHHRRRLLERWRHFKALLLADQPPALAIVDAGESRRQVADFAAHRAPYDLVWFEHLSAWSWYNDLFTTPMVIDIDDLEDAWILNRLDAEDVGWWRGVRAQRTIAGWTRLQHDAARASTLVAVASDDDQRRLREPNAIVIPNAYPPPNEGLLSASHPRDHPVALFIGLLNYPPNADAARTLAFEVAPRLRERVPRVEVRIVGRAPPELAHELASAPVTVTGFVPEVATEIAQARVAILPIRYGGGTRIKAIEALAYGLPLVATSFAVHGLDVEDDLHVLIADDPEGLAVAAARVLLDRSLSRRLATAGRRLYRERYSTDVVEPIIARAARQACAASS